MIVDGYRVNETTYHFCLSRHKQSMNWSCQSILRHAIAIETPPLVAMHDHHVYSAPKSGESST